uniref:hypothetical protein n=1 Tax=Maribacter ulvicola TaxID=228959 RepID=UPI001FC9F099|nr:hypothetical protein [Maribacter ulvicola]
MRKIHTIGLPQAKKVMHLSAIAYNLKKYLKLENKRPKSGAGKLAFIYKKYGSIREKPFSTAPEI